MSTRSGPRRLTAALSALALAVLGIGATAPPAAAGTCIQVEVTSAEFTLPDPVVSGGGYCLDVSGLPGAGAVTAATDWGWSDEVSSGLVDLISDYSAGEGVLFWTPLGRPAKSGSHLTLDTPEGAIRIDYTWAEPTLNDEPAIEVFREDGNPAYPNSRPSQDGGWWNDEIITLGAYPTTMRLGETTTTVPLQVRCSNPYYNAETGNSSLVLKLWDLTTNHFVWPGDIAYVDAGVTFGRLGDTTDATTDGSWTQTGGHWTWTGTATFTLTGPDLHSLAVHSYGSPCNGGGVFGYLPPVYVVDPHGIADAASTTARTPVLIDVLANDPEGSELGQVTEAPEHGTTRIVDDAIEYTPEAGFVGTDVFRYDLQGVDGDVEVTVTVETPAPGAPQHLAVVRTTSTGVELSWDAPDEVGAGVSDYVVFASPAGEDEFETVGATDGRSAVVDGLLPGTAYDLAVQTVATDDQLSPWATVTATTAAGTIAPVAGPRTVRTGGATRITVGGVSAHATVTLGPLARGVATATVAGRTVTLRTQRGFTGVISQPVVVGDDGATATLHLRVQVRPLAPGARTFTAADHGRTLVSWTRRAGATGYVVTDGTDVVCRTGARATSCLAPALLGPRTHVRVAAQGRQGTASPALRAAYRAPSEPVVVASIGFGTDRVRLDAAARAQVRALAAQLASQGLTRIEVRGYAAAMATDAASRADQQRASRLRATATATALRAALRAHGSRAKVRVVWFGAADPVADNLAFDGRILNRRADVVVH